MLKLTCDNHIDSCTMGTNFIKTKFSRDLLNHECFNIQGVSEVRVLILTSERTRQFMKLFSITFVTFVKVFQKFLPHNFYQTSRFV
jgi:hypothetical protein